MQDYTKSKKPALRLESQKIPLTELLKAIQENNESLEKATSTEKIDLDHSHSMEIIKYYLEKISADLSNSFIPSSKSEEDHLPNNQDNELDILVNLLKEYTQKKIHNSNVIIISSLFLLLFLTGASLSTFLYVYQSYNYGASFFYSDMNLSNNLIVFLFLCQVGLFAFLCKKSKDTYRSKEMIDRNLAKIIRTTSQAEEHVHSGFGKKLELDVRLTEAENALKNPLL
jgi:hypothetical protein